MRTVRIKKDAAGIATAGDNSSNPPETFELKDMNVEEVSMVDKPANGRAFLVKKRATKKSDAASTDTAAEEVIDLAAEVDKSGTAEPEADRANAEKDAADAAAHAADLSAEGSKSEKAAPAAATVTETIDTAAALAALTDGVKKTDITVSPDGDGGLVVAVSDTPPEPVAAAPAEVTDKCKAAVLAGIDAIGQRLAMFRGKVEADGSASPWDMSGRPEICSDVWYIRDMLDALYNIGGPAWEIEAAGDSATDVDKAAVVKGHKAITGSRIAKMKAIHKGLSYCMKDYGALMKELDTESEQDEQDVPADTAMGAAKAAPVATSEAATAAPASVEKDINDLRAQVSSLSKTVNVQASQLAKSRDSVQQSNSALPKEENQNRDKVIWPSDLADPAEYARTQRR